MPKRDDAIELLERNGHADAAGHVRNWRNVDGGTGGWDANLKRSYPACIPLLWPRRGGAPTVPARPAATLATPALDR